MQIAVAGATGRTGSLIVKEALKRGHTVRALTRQSGRASHEERLEWISGALEDPATARQLVVGVDAVISAIGPRYGGRRDTCSTSTWHLITSGAERLIVVSGMGVTLPEDKKGLIDKIASGVVRVMSPHVFADKVREIELLRQSSINWTAIRVGALLDVTEPRPVKVDVTTPTGPSITIGSLAALCVDLAENGSFICQAPFAGN